MGSPKIRTPAAMEQTVVRAPNMESFTTSILPAAKFTTMLAATEQKTLSMMTANQNPPSAKAALYPAAPLLMMARTVKTTAEAPTPYRSARRG